MYLSVTCFWHRSNQSMEISWICYSVFEWSDLVRLQRGFDAANWREKWFCNDHWDRIVVWRCLLIMSICITNACMQLENRFKIENQFHQLDGTNLNSFRSHINTSKWMAKKMVRFAGHYTYYQCTKPMHWWIDVCTIGFVIFR